MRVRPPLPREQAAPGFKHGWKLRPDGRTIDVLDDSTEGLAGRRAFAFDGVFSPTASQAEIFEALGVPAAKAVASGESAVVLAYGQTGSGKTFAVEGGAGELAGLMPRAVSRLFALAAAPFRLSCLEVYNEGVSDLLQLERGALPVREDKARGFYVEGLSEWPAHDAQEALELLRRATESRATAGTRANEKSSRSHALFRVHAGKGCLTLVDLAGSERLRATGATGQRLEECKRINQSLSALGNVVAALADPARPFVPYRDSKLTMLLADVLGTGQAALLATLAPGADCLSETLSTLKFARRVKRISCTPRPPSSGGTHSQTEAELRAALARERVAGAALARRLKQAEQGQSNDRRADECRALLAEQQELMVKLLARMEQRDQQLLELQTHIAGLTAVHAQTQAIIEAKNQRISSLERALAQKPSKENRFSADGLRPPSERAQHAPRGGPQRFTKFRL